LKAGRAQQQILEGLRRGDYDLARAETLVEERVTPLVHPARAGGSAV